MCRAPGDGQFVRALLSYAGASSKFGFAGLFVRSSVSTLAQVSGLFADGIGDSVGPSPILRPVG